MIRRFKSLGLTLAAVLAVSAVMATVASAVEYHTSSDATTTLSGTQSAANKLHIPNAGTVDCTVAKFPGTVSGTAVKEVRVTPEYIECTAFGFATTHVITKECHLLFTQPTTASSTLWHAFVHVECTGTNKIKITPTFFGASVCTIEIGSQSTSGVVDFENRDTESHVLATSTVSGINHTAGCGASAGSDGEYTGSVTVKGGANKVWVT